MKHRGGAPLYSPGVAKQTDADAEGRVPLQTRVEPELKEALERWATAEDRSLSAQIRRVLADAVPAKYTQNGDHR